MQILTVKIEIQNENELYTVKEIEDALNAFYTAKFAVEEIKGTVDYKLR